MTEDQSEVFDKAVAVFAEGFDGVCCGCGGLGKIRTTESIPGYAGGYGLGYTFDSS